jgi:hypothetical protein
VIDKQKEVKVDACIADEIMELNQKGVVLNEMLTGNANLLVLYDDDNPPERGVELRIDLDIK